MNVRNLKQLFQKNGPIKQKTQLPDDDKLPANRRSTVAINPSREVTTKPTKIEIISSPQSSNKDFLSELNNKLDNKHINNFERLSGGSFGGAVGVKTQQKKEQCQISFDDIIQGVGRTKSQQQDLKVRYGINQHVSGRVGRKNMLQVQNQHESTGQNKSFTELLQKMVMGLIIIKQSVQEPNQCENSHKSLIVNKYEYGQANVSQDQKAKRIDFVLSVVFGSNDFQLIPPNQLHQRKEVEQIPSSVLPHFKSTSQEKAIQEQTVLSNNFKTLQTITSLPVQQVRPVSTNFLAQLSMKLQKKQMQNGRNVNHYNITNNGTNQAKRKSTQKQKNERQLTPRQNKKHKHQQKFDDL